MGGHHKLAKSGDWQISLCQKVAIHCPAALPSKDVFAQRKVPRPVSPLPGGAATFSGSGSSGDPKKGGQLLSLSTSVSDILADIATDRVRDPSQRFGRHPLSLSAAANRGDIEEDEGSPSEASGRPPSPPEVT